MNTKQIQLITTASTRENTNTTRKKNTTPKTQIIKDVKEDELGIKVGNFLRHVGTYPPTTQSHTSENHNHHTVHTVVRTSDLIK
jgi:hypothetical protein